jgi:two-component system LytT family response regulator
MKLLIIEADELIAGQIEMTIRESFKNIEIIGQAHSLKEALKLVYVHKPELLVMNTILGQAISFELFEYVDPDVFTIVFLSAHKEFAVEAIQFNAAAYLLTPLNQQELLDAVNKAITQSRYKQARTIPDLSINNMSENIIYLSENYLNKPVHISTLIRISSDGSYSVAYLSGGKTIHLSKNLGHFEKSLKDKGFIRAHKTALVNSDYIMDYKPGIKPRIILSDDTELPLARTKKQEIIRLLCIRMSAPLT